MSDLPPLVRDQRKVDADHLRLLAIFHFIGAGLAVIGMLFILVHYSFMHFFFANPRMWEGQKNGPPPAELFALFKWFYLAFGLWLLVSLVLNLISGFFLRARKGRTFSLVVAGVNCVHIPLGRILGIFTIIVLLRDSVRELYEA
jgi:hypothetical protein